MAHPVRGYLEPLFRSMSAFLGTTFFNDNSALVMISVAEMLFGVTFKLKPFLGNETTALLRTMSSASGLFLPFFFTFQLEYQAS